MGRSGSLFIDDTVTGKAFEFLVVNVACVFTVLEDTAGTDMLVDCNLSAKTISQGMKIVAPENSNIAKVTLSSGSVIGYE